MIDILGMKIGKGLCGIGTDIVPERYGAKGNKPLREAFVGEGQAAFCKQQDTAVKRKLMQTLGKSGGHIRKHEFRRAPYERYIIKARADHFSRELKGRTCEGAAVIEVSASAK